MFIVVLLLLLIFIYLSLFLFLGYLFRLSCLAVKKEYVKINKVVNYNSKSLKLEP